ncbi:hypothetical protein BD311DRAFT_743534 [Dichomitus squalens]|uniref:Uncharacterized protein n=1 Tax=Dichomitus squalens TaxID=114155 RepID=A0A4Q9M7D6_9APHY|nr:hypothetical protein BD311DRAFT_743534 [Dichomitus squalens]
MSLFAKPADFDNPPNQSSLHCPPVIVVVLTTPNHSTLPICLWTQGVEHEGKGEELWTQQGTFPSIQSLDKRSRQQRQKHVDTCMEMVHGDQGNAGNLRGPLQVYAQTGPLRCRHVDDGPVQVVVRRLRHHTHLLISLAGEVDAAACAPHWHHGLVLT